MGQERFSLIIRGVRDGHAAQAVRSYNGSEEFITHSPGCILEVLLQLLA